MDVIKYKLKSKEKEKGKENIEKGKNQNGPAQSWASCAKRSLFAASCDK